MSILFKSKKIFHNLFLPHPENNHRAKILHPRIVLFTILFILVINFSIKIISANRPDILGFAVDISKEALLRETNRQRIANNLNPLKLDQQLGVAAFNKAQDMFKDNYWSHVSPLGKTPWDFVSGEKYSYLYAGENLAKDFQDSSSVVAAWMESPTHRDNILNSKYQDIGFAVVNGKLEGEDTTLIVQFFGTRTSDNYLASTENEQKSLDLSDKAMKPAKNITSPNKIRGNQIIKLPQINYFNLIKKSTTIFLLLLSIVLLADAFIIYRKKIVRLGGDSYAHLLLLCAFLTVLLSLGRGSIL